MVDFLGEYSSNMKLADLHIHSTESDGLMSPAEIVERARKIGLSGLAIVDHEVTSGGKLAQEYCQSQGYNDIEVVVGSEISTKGHLVGLYLKEDIPSGKSLEWTIQAIHAQGGLVIAPHPFFFLTRYLGAKTLMAVINNPHPEIYFDGFEVWSGAVCAHRLTELLTNGNTRAKAFYLEHQKCLGAAIGSTDTHHRALGQGLTGYTGNLREAILASKTTVHHADKRENVIWTDFCKQVYCGMGIEPIRRVKRYAQRELVGLLGA